MPDPSTTRLALYKSKSDGSETVNYSQDLGQNWDKIDAAVGFASCTASTRPSSPYSGKAIMQTDTSYSTYFHNGTSPASGGWVEIPNSSAVYGGRLITLFQGSTSASSLVRLAQTGSASGNRALATRGSGDTVDHWQVDFDGRMQWGPGGSTVADVNLYRSGANVLATDDALTVALTLTAQVETVSSGATAATNWTTTTFSGRRTCGIATVYLVMTYGGTTITANSAGNITDQLAVTLPSGWRPNAGAVAVFDKSGQACGDVVIGSDGTCTLKTLDATATISSGDTVTFSSTFVL